jgi:hypothetical protein
MAELIEIGDHWSEDTKAIENEKGEVWETIENEG